MKYELITVKFNIKTFFIKINLNLVIKQLKSRQSDILSKNRKINISITKY